jgi:hypothetical protein
MASVGDALHAPTLSRIALSRQPCRDKAGDGDAEVFGDLAAIEQGADGAADLVGPA